VQRSTVQRIKATRAAKSRPVLPAAVMRSAPFPPVVVGETVGLELPELPDEVVLAFVVEVVLRKTGEPMSDSSMIEGGKAYVTELDEDVESEAVMLNVPD